MLRRTRPARLVACCAAAAALASLAGCGGEEVDRVPIETEEVFVDPFAGVPPQRTPSVVRAAGFLPRALDRVRVTDLDQVRERLGESALDFDGPSPQALDVDLWARADAESALLTGGLLRPVDARLERDYGFGPDDVLWEASATDVDGEVGDAWVLAFHGGVDPGALQRAADDGVGVLAGGRVLAQRRIVLAGAARADPADSWRETAAAVGAGTQGDVESVYLRAACVPLADALGGAPPAAEARADQVRAEHGLDDHEPMEAFAVVFSESVATVRLGMAPYDRPRGDLFAREELADDWPAGSGFHEAFQKDPTVDPSTGRIGYTLLDPAAAAELTGAGVAPYAVCPED